MSPSALLVLSLCFVLSGPSWAGTPDEEAETHGDRTSTSGIGGAVSGQYAKETPEPIALDKNGRFDPNLLDPAILSTIVGPDGNVNKETFPKFLTEHPQFLAGPVVPGQLPKFNDDVFNLLAHIKSKQQQSTDVDEIRNGPNHAPSGVRPGLGGIGEALTPHLKLEAATDMINLFPQLDTGYEKAGDAQLGLGQPEKAVQMYNEAYNRNPTPENLYKRAYAADKAGDYQQANSDARAVLEERPDDKAAQSLYMLTRSRPSKVRLLDASALEADDGRLAAAGMGGSRAPQFDGRSAAAPGAFAPSRTAESIAAEENAAINGRSVTAQSAKLTADAKMALRVKDPAKALRLSEEAIQADPSNATARYVRATAFLQQGRPDMAVQEASAGLALVPDNAPLLYTRAVGYGRQKLWKQAYSDADRSVREAPNAAYAYRARAASNWGMKNREAMMSDLRAAARIDRRYAEDIKRAVEGPEDVDPTLLFGDLPSDRPAPAPAPTGHLPRYALWGAGLVLAVLGMLPVLFPSVRRQVTTVLRRGPAVAEDEAGAGGEAPVSGFWRRYEVMREIGAGGMGVVYEAWDKNLERRVAVKRMRDEIRQDRRERERFLQEARTVAQMRHPNLVEIYSIEEDGDDAYLVFEFVEGKTLHEHIAEKGTLTPAEARDVFRGLCAGVDYAHRRGIVHRDLKPANVIVETDGTVKVMDFGVARYAQDALVNQQMTNTVIGTPPYMAPEQEQGVVCAQSDVYALGVCLYEALAGVLPFQGTAGAVLLAKMQAKYEPLQKRSPGLPPGVYALVDRALDPKPESRIQSAAELFKELEAAVGVPA